jgi:hypothetical protein
MEGNSQGNSQGIVDNVQNKISNITSNIGQSAYNFANKGKEVLIQNINDFIESPKIAKISQQGEDYLGDFNNKINNPIFKKQANETLENVSDYMEMGLKAMDKPIDEAIVKLNDAGTKAASGTLSSAIKVGTDAIAAIPGIGAVVELGKIANDASKGISSLVDAGSQVSETVDDFFTDVNKNMDQLSQKGGEIMERTIHSIDEFHQPIRSTLRSSLRTSLRSTLKKNKKFIRRKNKTKRVRFSL